MEQSEVMTVRPVPCSFGAELMKPERRHECLQYLHMAQEAYDSDLAFHRCKHTWYPKTLQTIHSRLFGQSLGEEQVAVEDPAVTRSVSFHRQVHRGIL